MTDVAYVLVVCAYNWENLGYVNNSLTQLLMVDNTFSPVGTIPFGIWNFKGLEFTTHYGQFYNRLATATHARIIYRPDSK